MSSNTRKDGDFNLDQELFDITAATEENKILDDSIEEITEERDYDTNKLTPQQQFEKKYHINPHIKKREELCIL